MPGTACSIPASSPSLLCLLSAAAPAPSFNSLLRDADPGHTSESLPEAQQGFPREGEQWEWPFIIILHRLGPLHSTGEDFSGVVLWFSFQCCAAERCREHRMGMCVCGGMHDRALEQSGADLWSFFPQSQQVLERFFGSYHLKSWPGLLSWACSGVEMLLSMQTGLLTALVCTARNKTFS